MTSTENIGSMLMNSKHRNGRSNKPVASVAQAVLADSVVADKVSLTETVDIGTVPMVKASPAVMPAVSPISSNQCSVDIAVDGDKVLRDSADRILMPNFTCLFVMLLRRINRC